MRCRTPFTFTNRKHHCRNCGNVFCGPCSSKTIPLPHLGISEARRVDDGCYAKLSDKNNRSVPVPRHFEAPRPSRTLYQSSLQPRDAVADTSFDADLKKALEMSLEESKDNSGSGYISQNKLRSESRTPKATSKSSTKPKVKDDEEDADLKAAIAASLDDMEEQKRQHTETFKKQSSMSNGSKPAPRRTEYELSHAESENINLFSTLVDRLHHQPPGTILREPQIQELYDSIGTLRPKLARTYGETMSKHDTLLDLHSKLATVVRYYDRMLEERLSSTYSHHQYGGYASVSNTHPQQSSMYPLLSGQGMNGGPESFYTGNAGPMDPYAGQSAAYAVQPNPSSPYAQYQSQNPQYPQHDLRQRAGSNVTTSSGRAPSLKYRQASSDYMPATPSRQVSSKQGMPQNQYFPPQSGGSQAVDPATSYYYNNQTTGQQHQQPVSQTLQSPQQNFYPTPDLTPQQPMQPPQLQTFGQQPPPQAQQAPPPQYAPPQGQQYQPPSQAAPLSQPPQQQTYAQSAFPSAPSHQPEVAEQAPREESLIEL